MINESYEKIKCNFRPKNWIIQ